MSNPVSTYLFAYDASTLAGVSQGQLAEYVKHNKNIDKWWSFIPFVYIFNSTKNQEILIEMFTDFLESDSANFILSPIDPVAFNGFLPQEAWSAFKNDIENPYKKMRDQ